MSDPTLTDPRSARAAFDQTGLSSKYELLDEVGRGGMGIVYRGRHRLLDQPVAIKVHALADGADRFHREARILASVQSRHVVRVQDFDVLPDGRAMLVMAWVPGSDLGRVVGGAAGPLPPARVVGWMQQVCEGMRAAAEQGIVHRDLKPSNILVDHADLAYVADFGLARAAGTDPLTLVGGVMGTPLYMAPEQAEDPRGVDTRADVYSFGATFYHALTGHPPHTGESWFSILLKHKSEPLVAPRTRCPALGGWVNDCLERCLAKSPSDRFQSFRELGLHLEAAAAGAPRAAPEDGEVARHLERYLARRPVYLGGRPAGLPEPDAYEFPHGRVCTIGFGNLADQYVDAVVSSDDESLSMGGGVSAALARAVGGSYKATAARYAPVQPGRAVVTPAGGSLPARFVMHGVTKGRWGTGWVAPSHDLLNEIMEGCFYHADTLGLKSVAFPLLATGAGRFSREVCLDTMVRFLARKMTRGLTTVREARVVIWAPVPDGS